jgi:hypothetical protein
MMISSIRSCALRAPVLRTTTRTVGLVPIQSVRPQFPIPPRPTNLVQARFQHTQPPSTEELAKKTRQIEAVVSIGLVAVCILVGCQIGSALANGTYWLVRYRWEKKEEEKLKKEMAKQLMEWELEKGKTQESYKRRGND